MESFSLLKYWRGTATATTTTTKDPTGANLRTSPTTTTTTISTTITHSATEETDDDDADDNADGPFFDLEFAVPDDENDELEKQTTTDGGDEEREEDGTDDGEEEEREEFNFTLSPSDDLFFNGNLIPVEPASIVIDDGSEPVNVKPHFSLLKSASKFGVLMLKLKKLKPNAAGEIKTEPDAASTAKQNEKEEEEEPQTQKQKPSQSKFFTVKLKVEEVPIVSLFTRDNSSRASSGTINNKSQKIKEGSSSDVESGPDEKRFSKDGVQKYLKMVKPLYIRVSKRYGEKSEISGLQSPVRSEVQKSEKTEAVLKSEVAGSEAKTDKHGKFLPAGLRVACKHLGKSRSASSAAVAAAPSCGAVTKQGRRRDDSLLEQQDGIQSAILHCKRSFNLSRDSESSTTFSRSVSDPSPKHQSN
ncbi:hypothetical protein Vadar_003428 [Vaccinium darrowii]|uniref:Uncharacterized protein n=1 Tax=Vaccinium darrowii TaxID=229202 RepID=A0ACB7XF21_9ERIC|nr:hypothetical protein Vadar_003428 [Vaccinium darrowii]